MEDFEESQQSLDRMHIGEEGDDDQPLVAALGRGWGEDAGEGGDAPDCGADDYYDMPLSNGDDHGLSLPPPPPSLVLNPTAYATFKDNPEEFENQVRCTLSGGYHFQAEFRDAYHGAAAAVFGGGYQGMEGLGETPRKRGKRKYSMEDFEESQQSLDRMHIGEEGDDDQPLVAATPKRLKMEVT
eukprot:CAMPEP_0182487072 /NCGR_PEP_ID=MMETSP1319-20130603/47718_1 /TAXON_ID=172717 /ORGANISM="Bolidomonas pacifica, Strain RCC208" /LENGTH=183 /DNA_ID=CAMNT_0024689181 /DNA_START=519 /DNA_END=1071 /DNA_ORIENTATION=-